MNYVNYLRRCPAQRVWPDDHERCYQMTLRVSLYGWSSLRLGYLIRKTFMSKTYVPWKLTVDILARSASKLGKARNKSVKSVLVAHILSRFLDFRSSMCARSGREIVEQFYEVPLPLSYYLVVPIISAYTYRRADTIITKCLTRLSFCLARALYDNLVRKYKIL